MALKDILLAASIGTTMIGTNTEAKETVAPPITPQQMQTLSPAEIQEMNFQKNYRHLYKNVDGAWFSFGDEKKMRQTLYDIGSFAMGREIIANIPENMEFGSSNFMPSKIIGGFDLADNSLNMNTNYIDGYTFDTTGTLIDLRGILFHELLHAYQKKQGIALVDDHASIDELLHAQKLIEAETAAWNKVLNTTTQLSSTNSYFLRPEEVRDLMHRDLVAEERKEWEDIGMKKDFNTRQEAHFKKTDSRYLLQQALIACNGNYDLAQKKLVAEEMKNLMNSTVSEWHNNYNKQALTVIATLCVSKKISEHGNPTAYKKMLNYYKKTYGLNPQDIPNTQLATEHTDTIAKFKAEMKEYNLYSDSERRPDIRLAQQKRGGR